jgi:hypothetical protein
VRAVTDNSRLRLAAIKLVLLAVLVTLATASVAPAFGTLPWHGPDAHSSRPHRGADSPFSADDAASRALPPVLSSWAEDHVMSEPLPLANRLASGSAFHPPQ